MLSFAPELLSPPKMLCCWLSSTFCWLHAWASPAADGCNGHQTGCTRHRQPWRLSAYPDSQLIKQCNELAGGCINQLHGRPGLEIPCKLVDASQQGNCRCSMLLYSCAKSICLLELQWQLACCQQAVTELQWLAEVHIQSSQELTVWHFAEHYLVLRCGLKIILFQLCRFCRWIWTCSSTGSQARRTADAPHITYWVTLLRPTEYLESACRPGSQDVQIAAAAVDFVHIRKMTVQQLLHSCYMLPIDSQNSCPTRQLWAFAVQIS